MNSKSEQPLQYKVIDTIYKIIKEGLLKKEEINLSTEFISSDLEKILKRFKSTPGGIIFACF